MAGIEHAAAGMTFFTEQDWRLIAAAAGTLDERLAGGFLASDQPSSLVKARRRLAAWRDSASAGNDEDFQRRIAWEGWRIEDILPLLGDVRLAEDATLPPWIDTARWLLDAMIVPALDPAQAARFLRSDGAMPFEDLLAPAVLAASSRLKHKVGGSRDRLGPEAWAALERELLLRLGELVAVPLFEYFDAFRFVRRQGAFGVAVTGTTDGGLYAAFIHECRGTGLRDFLLQRPVLVRVLATTALHWIEATAEFITHLTQDFDELTRCFGPPGARHVTKIESSGADLHGGSRCVVFVTLEGGARIVYKPRSLALDIAWRDLLDWLAGRRAPQSACMPVTLDRGDHGWVQFIEPRPVDTRNQAAQFFGRAGATLCLFYVMQGWDMHFENVIAQGELPFPVDLESLFHPWPPVLERETGPARAQLKALSKIYGSVLACGYLPNWVVARPGQLLGIGGLSPENEISPTRRRFAGTNTDAMRFIEVVERPDPSQHLPRLGGAPIKVADFIDEIEAGFRAMYQFLMTHAEELNAPNGPLSWFPGQRVRAILRPTQLYLLVLKRSLESRHLGNGVDWSLHWDFLARFSEFDGAHDPLARVLRLERDAFRELDIPLFRCRTDECDIESAEGGIVKNYLRTSSYTQVRARLAELSLSDLDAQLAMIRQSLESTDDEDRRTLRRSFPASDAASTADPDRSLQWARRIAGILAASAIEADGGATWIGVVPLPGEERAQLEIAGHDLYAGTTGIAVFLAALAHIDPGAGTEELARAAVASLRADLADAVRAGRLARRIGIGGTTGVGSIVYGLTLMGRLLHDPALLESAATAAALIDAGRIARDQSLDLFSGTAGAVLGLLALYDTQGDPQVLAQAVACGEFLLQRALPSGDDAVAWRNGQKQILTGYSHGAAGIALALARLFARTGDRRFVAAATKALNFERHAFLPGPGNWPDFRVAPPPGGEPPCLCRVCHGAPGIGVARAAMRAIVDDDDLDGEIATAVRTTEANLYGMVDDLCCGNFGRVQALLAIGEMTGDAALVRRTATYTRQLIDRIESQGHFLWTTGHDRQNPGLFVGLAGIGYGLLRDYRHDKLPCVVSFALPA